MLNYKLIKIKRIYYLESIMKFYSQLKKTEIILKGTIGLAGDWKSNTLGNSWILFSLQKRFPGAEVVDVTDVKNTKCCFLIFSGNFNVPIEFNVPCPYVVIGYSRNYDVGQFTDFVKKALIFTVRDYSTSTTLDFLPHSSFDPSLLYGNKQHRCNKEVKYIKFVWRNLTDIKNENVYSSIYIGDLPYWVSCPDNTALYVRMRGEIEKFGLSSSDEMKIVYDDKTAREKTIDTDIIVSGDYYSLLLGFQYGIPCVAINTCPAIKCLMHDSSLKEYCIDVKDILTLPAILKKAVPKEARENMIKLQNLFVLSNSQLIKQTLDAVENKILSTIESINGSIEELINDPVVIDKLDSESKISNIALEIMSKYPDQQKLELIEKMKIDFDRFHKASIERIKYAIEIEKIKEEERKKEIARLNRLDEETKKQKLKELEPLKKEITVSEVINDSINFEGSALRSIHINNMLKQLINNNNNQQEKITFQLFSKK